MVDGDPVFQSKRVVVFQQEADLSLLKSGKYISYSVSPGHSVHKSGVANGGPNLSHIMGRRHCMISGSRLVMTCGHMPKSPQNGGRARSRRG
jgi:hypothetical protein